MTAESSRPLIPPTPLPEPDSAVESDGRVAMDFTGHRGKVITNSKEAAAVAGTRPRVVSVAMVTCWYYDNRPVASNTLSFHLSLPKRG